MTSNRYSIRNQLLILGAIATGSIWAGAFFQFRGLQHETLRLEQVRSELSVANQYSAVAQFAARERGITNGWLRRSGADPFELAAPRDALDRALVAIHPDERRPLDPAVMSRLEDLGRQRGLVDRRQADPAALFSWYSALIAAVQDTSAKQLARGMVEFGLPYEHVNHLHRAVEQLAQVRGLSNGALGAGTLTDADRSDILRVLTLHEEYLRLYEQSAPPATLTANIGAVASRSVRETVDRVHRLLETHQLDALNAPGGWWPLATEAIDTLERVAAGESAALTALASTRMQQLEQRMRYTVFALVVLGVLTLSMVLATVGRIVHGLNSLLAGLESAATRRNFKTRIDDSRQDEFGTISGSINKLIAIASTVVDEHEQQALTDPLTDLLNRRGMDQQLQARMNSQRHYAVPTSVLMIDADRFKAINDDFGHPVGDRVLVDLARVISKNLRPDDVAGRYGGEEFMAVLQGCPRDEALAVAEKLRVAVAAHDFGLGRTVTVSIGVAQWCGETDPVDVVSRADVALYRAKAEGRNGVRVHDLTPPERERMLLLA